MADMTETATHPRSPYLFSGLKGLMKTLIFPFVFFLLSSRMFPHIFGFKKENKFFCLPGSFLENKEEMIITGVQILFHDNNLKVNEINHETLFLCLACFQFCSHCLAPQILSSFTLRMLCCLYLLVPHLTMI